MAAPNPLARSLAVQQQYDVRMNAILRDALADARARLAKLAGKDGLGTQVRAGQLRQTIAALTTTQAQLWQQALPTIKQGRVTAARSAAATLNAESRQLWNKLLGPIPQLEKALEEQAASTVDTLAARLDNAIPLSDQVYKTAAYSKGYVDRAINRSILAGDSWKELADRVTPLVNPNTPGGVSFAAKRLARTELNNSFHRASVQGYEESPFVTGVQWHLSGSHKVPDKCNDYAGSQHVKGQPAGVFASDAVPGKPHPQCFCFITAVQVDEQQFIEDFFQGKYNQYVDETVYKNGQGVC